MRQNVKLNYAIKNNTVIVAKCGKLQMAHIHIDIIVANLFCFTLHYFLYLFVYDKF